MRGEKNFAQSRQHCLINAYAKEEPNAHAKEKNFERHDKMRNRLSDISNERSSGSSTALSQVPLLSGKFFGLVASALIPESSGF